MLNVILWKKGIDKDLHDTTDDDSVMSEQTAENLEMDFVHAMDKVRNSIVVILRFQFFIFFEFYTFLQLYSL